MSPATWKTRLAAVGLATVVASSAVAAGSAGVASAASQIPASAMSDHTGVTSNSVSIGNVSTLAVGGLFKGALVGTEAYAAYVNSTGGINGRKIKVDSGDDGFSGSGNKQATQNAINNDFALVGGFSLQDNFGGALLKAKPGMPDVTMVLDQTTAHLPNVYSAVPLDGGWELGPLYYFKKKFPNAVKSVGTIVSNVPSAMQDWAGEKYAMEKVGYKVVYDPTIPVTQTDFTANVIAMKNAGVKIVFLDQLPQNYASGVFKAMTQQNFHPQVVLGSANYSRELIPNSGGAAAVNGSWFDSNTSLFLGEDAAIPAVPLFNKWVQKVSPGFHPDLFTLYGWLSAQLFSTALKNSGKSPSRGSLLQALNQITTFSGNNIVTPANPVDKTISNCYLIGKLVNGIYTRVDDPPLNSSTHGYRCDYKYVVPPAS